MKVRSLTRNDNGRRQHMRSKQDQFFGVAVQPKLTVNTPGDQFEQEADAMADRVMRRNARGATTATFLAKPAVYRKCANCQEEENVLRSEMTTEETVMTNPRAKRLFAHDLVRGSSGGRQDSHLIQREENGEPADSGSFEFDFEMLPPSLKLSLGHWMLKANTSNAELQFARNLIKYRLGYDYGGSLYSRLNFGDFGAKVGVDPATGAFSLGLSQNKFKLKGSVDPIGSGFGLGFGYGAPLLPFPWDLKSSVTTGGDAASAVLGDIGSLSDPLDFYNKHGENIGAIMGAIKALKPVASAGEETFGAGLRFQYNPSSGLLVHGGLQWMF